MHVVVLSARTGWHTDELCRALAARGHVGVVLPYESLLARMGRDSRAPGATADSLSAQGVSLFDATGAANGTFALGINSSSDIVGY
jgi:hypothetical protein